MAKVVTTLKQKTSSGWGTEVPIGTKTQYVFRVGDDGTTIETLSSILTSIETRLANIEACLKEVAQEDDLVFNNEKINPVG